MPFRNIGLLPALDAELTARVTLVPTQGSGEVALSETAIHATSGRLVYGRNQMHNNVLFLPAGSHEQIDRINSGTAILRVLLEMTLSGPACSAGSCDASARPRNSGCVGSSTSLAGISISCTPASSRRSGGIFA